MQKLLKIGALAILSVFIFSSITFAEEKITITTYYPSPYGVYNELRAKRMAVGDDYISSTYQWATSDTPGTNEFSKDADLLVEGKVGIGYTIPSANLDIKGANNGNDSASLALRGGGDGTNPPAYIMFHKASGSAPSGTWELSYGTDLSMVWGFWDDVNSTYANFFKLGDYSDDGKGGGTKMHSLFEFRGGGEPAIIRAVGQHSGTTYDDYAELQLGCKTVGGNYWTGPIAVDKKWMMTYRKNDELQFYYSSDGSTWNGYTPLRLQPNGNVLLNSFVGNTGIGTQDAAPQAKLDVVGDAKVSGNASVGGTLTTGGTMTVGGTLKLGTGTCDSSHTGQLGFNGTLQYCNGTAWKNVQIAP